MSKEEYLRARGWYVYVPIQHDGKAGWTDGDRLKRLSVNEALDEQTERDALDAECHKFAVDYRGVELEP